MEVLQWAREQDPPCPCYQDVCDFAAQRELPLRRAPAAAVAVHVAKRGLGDFHCAA